MLMKTFVTVTEILDIIDHADEMTRSDLQGVVEALVGRIITDIIPSK